MARQGHQETDVFAIVVGGVIMGLRKHRGITQTELADQIGVTQSTLSRMERGLGQPDAFTLRKLADAFGTTTGELTLQIEKAYKETEVATRGLVQTSQAEPWWKTALKVAGVVGVAGVVAFIVASIIEEQSEE